MFKSSHNTLTRKLKLRPVCSGLYSRPALGSSQTSPYVQTYLRERI
jgi:hypothetical protein